MMTLVPPDWTYASANPAAMAMFGLESEAQLISLRPGQLSPERQPDGRLSLEKAREAIGIAMRDGVHFFEWTHRRADGETFPGTVLLARIELGGRSFLQATIRDITEQKRAEDAVREKHSPSSRPIANSKRPWRGRTRWPWRPRRPTSRRASSWPT